MMRDRPPGPPDPPPRRHTYRISFEPHRSTFHDCPERGIMLPVKSVEPLTSFDGISKLPAWECAGCGRCYWAGVERKTRRVVQIPFPPDAARPGGQEGDGGG